MATNERKNGLGFMSSRHLYYCSAADGKGSTRANVQPLLPLFFNSSVAPRWFANCLLIAKPIPLPCSLLEWHGENKLAFIPSGRPGPSSCTSNVSWSPVHAEERLTFFPAGVASTAFWTR